MTLPSTFNRNSTADQVLEGKNLSGKIAMVTGANGGGLMALVVEFTGLAAANIYVNGVLQAVSGTPNCGPVAAGQRFRIGSIRTDVGNSFSTPLDGFIEEFLVFPSTGAEIRTAVRNLFLERHPGMTIAA